VRSLSDRFNQDFHFALIVSFGLLAIVAVSGFAVFRFLTGAWAGAAINSGIVLAVALVVIYTIRTGNTARAGLVFAIINVVACIASSVVFGRTGILWGFVGLWINFLLTHRRIALGLNLILIAVLALENQLFESVVEVLTYVITAGLVTVFGFIFAERLDSQQRKLEILASRDPLTQAGNRRSMKQDLAEAVENFQQGGHPCALMLLDLDHFKAINDEYGHEAGDRVLQDFARTIRQHVRAGDGLYRFGGEEFVLLFPGAGPQVAEEFASQLHRITSGVLEGPAGPLHFSAGVAVLRAGETWEQWLGRADKAMYKAKKSGRNRLEIISNPREAADPAGVQS